MARAGCGEFEKICQFCLTNRRLWRLAMRKPLEKRPKIFETGKFRGLGRGGDGKPC
jgi:hypothetical protein